MTLRMRLALATTLVLLSLVVIRAGLLAGVVRVKRVYPQPRVFIGVVE